MSLLKDATIYLSGPIEASQDPNSWRNRLRPKLEALGLVVWDPLVKPAWMHQITGPEQAAWKKLFSDPSARDCTDMIQCNDAKTKNREIRDVCLAITNSANMMIVKVDKKTFTVGTWEEVTIAAQQKKPTFFLVDGEENLIPSMWLVDMFDAYNNPRDVFFPSEDALFSYLKAVDDGNRYINNTRWAFKTYGGSNDKPSSV